ncbi:MAG: hypothetical protein PHN29_07035, partial [Endomicrobiaceae bacterium]|nr:hypothetical protein [Endomicrobiaceae bacterium]
GVEVVGGVLASVVGIFEAFTGLCVAIGSWITGNGFSEGWDSCFKKNNSSYLKLAASLIKDKQYSDVTSGEAASAAFSGVAVIAAVAVAVVGILASPFTAAASGVGGIVLAGYIIGAVIGTAVAAVGAGRAAFDASENIQMYIATGNEEYLKAGLINIGLSLFSILTAGMAADFGNIGAQLGAKLVGKGVLYASAVAAARTGGKAAVKTVVNAYETALAKSLARGATAKAAQISANQMAKFTAQKLGADVSKIIIKGVAQGTVNASGNAASQSIIKTALKNPWVIRGILAGGSSALDGLLSITGADQNAFFLGLHDIMRVFSVQGMLGISQISEGSWLNTEILGGLKISSILWTAGYVFGPSIANGIAGFVSGASKVGFKNQLKSTIAKVGSNFSKFGQYAGEGVRESAAKIGELFGRGGLQAGSRLSGAIQAWGSLGTNMYRMVVLNIGMSSTGIVLRQTGFVRSDYNGSSSLGGLLNFVFQDMGVDATGRTLSFNEAVTSAFTSDSLANSAMFGVVMYALMPMVSGLAKGVKGVSAAEEAASSKGFTNLFDGAKNFVTSIWEEGFNEGIVQALVTPFVGAQAAEYISEFAFPSTDGSISFMQTVQNVKYKTLSGAQNAAQSMTSLYANAGHTDITFEALEFNGGYQIVVSGLQGAANSIIQQSGIQGINAIYSNGMLSFEIGKNFSGDKIAALSQARKAVAQALGIDLNSLSEISGQSAIVTIGSSALSDIANRYTICEMAYSSESASGLQSIMMGAYNALHMPGFSANIGAKLTQLQSAQSEMDTVDRYIAAERLTQDSERAVNARQNLSAAIDSRSKAVSAITAAISEGRTAAAGITPSQVKVPTVADAFWNGDTRTSAKMLGVEINAARIVQLYGTEGKFDINKFLDKVKNAEGAQAFSQELEILTSVISLRGAGVNMEGFISDKDITAVLSSMVQDGGSEARMLIAQWGAMLAQNGLADADTMKVIITQLIPSGQTTLSLSDFGVSTVEQAQELGFYLAMIQQAAGRTVSKQKKLGIFTIEKITVETISVLNDVLNEIKKINDKYSEIQTKLNAQSLEKQQQTIDDEKRTLENTDSAGDQILLAYLNKLSVENQIRQLKDYNKSAIEEALNVVGFMSVQVINNLLEAGFDFTDIQALTGLSVSDMFDKQLLVDNILRMKGGSISDISIGNRNQTLTISDIIDLGVLSVDAITAVNLTGAGFVLAFSYSGNDYKINFSRGDLELLYKSTDIADKQYFEKIKTLAAEAQQTAVRKISERQASDQEITELSKGLEIVNGKTSSAVSAENMQAGACAS